MKKISIKWQILVSFLAFIVGLLTLIWFFQIALLDNFYKSIRLNQLNDIVKTIDNKLDYSDWEETLSKLSLTKEVSILIIDEKEDCVLFQNGGYNTINIDLNKTGLMNLIIRAKEENGEITLENNEIIESGIKYPFNIYENILKVKSIKTNGEIVTIFVSANLLPVDSTVNTLSKQLFIISIIMVMAASVVAFILSKKISTPIINLTKKSRYLGDSKREFNFLETGYEEIEELSEALNYANKELKKIDSLQKELIANVSHDLKTPLTMIRGYAEMMRDFKEEVTEENMNVIIDETIHLTDLVNNILDLSKIQSGVSVNNLEVFSITKVIESTISRYNQLLEVKKYKIEFLYEEHCFVRTDESKILQVIYNLLNNAINYIGEDKLVIIKQTIIGYDKVKIEIIDHGIGIPKDKQKYIWDRYYKVDKTHKRTNAGFGLGLSMVKVILESLNCEFGVQSEVDKGSNFYFILNIEEL